MIYNSILIKSKIKISTFIRETIFLKNKNNGNYLGLCPFHKEETPSFFVNDDKGMYHCFGCGAHGDLFNYIMERDGISYKDALIKMARFIGLDLRRQSDASKNQESQRHLIQNIYERALSYYKRELFLVNGSQALTYIRKRGITDVVIKKYELGYSPKKSTDFIKYLLMHFEEHQLISVGILNKKNSQLYDPLCHRLIFPIKDMHSQVIAFGGRVLQAKQQPKYLNSSNSILFSKKNSLYGYHIAKNAIYKEKTVIVVEGYMDVLSLANHNIINVVAPLGTAITKQQIQLLWEHCTEPVICFDNDLAGRKAGIKLAYEILPHIKENQSLQFILLQQGKDPDSIITNQGLSNLQQQMSQKLHLVDFLFQVECSRIDLYSPEKKVLLKKNLAKTCLLITDLQIQKSYQYHFRTKYFQLLKNKSNTTQLLRPELKKYFYELEENLELYLLIIGLLKVPSVLENNEILEDFIEINLPSYFDKIRRSILESRNNKTMMQSLLVGISDKYIQVFDKIYNSFDDIIIYIKRILTMRKIRIIQYNIAILQKNLLNKNSTVLMKRMLFFKRNEQKLEQDLATYLI